MHPQFTWTAAPLTSDCMLIASLIRCDAPQFYLDRDGKPSDCMRESLLYRMHSYRLDPLAPKLEHFEEAFTTTNRMVRIYNLMTTDDH